VSIPIKTDGLSLADALALGGSLNSAAANARKVYVIRGVEREGAGLATVVYQLNANSAVPLSVADRFAMVPGDVLYVAPAQISRWNRFISQLLPSASLIDTSQTIQERAQNN
jgi:polysaccharide export outer membrane protein